ncbi:hypothetical protein V8E52_009393, partial [Russula decolorans]
MLSTKFVLVTLFVKLLLADLDPLVVLESSMGFGQTLCLHGTGSYLHMWYLCSSLLHRYYRYATKAYPWTSSNCPSVCERLRN